ncbi:MAG: ECF transporter S component [Bacilli bacterium]|jgi:thiamine transporter ThiT
MISKNLLLIRKMVGIAVLIALTIVLTFISNYITIAGISINLSVLPVALAGILYGPLAGLFVGLVNGGLVLLAPATAGYIATNVWATIIVCLLKTGLAGLCSGFLFRLLYKRYFSLGVVIASILTPIINTGLFILGSLLFFGGLFGTLITIFISVNFIIEFSVIIVCCPTIIFLIKTLMKNYQDFFSIDDPKAKK